MTVEIAILLALLGAMVVLFLTEVIPVDLTAFCGLSILVLGGYLGPDEAFSGFASPAVITMLSIFVIGGALLRTGVADAVGAWVHRTVGESEPLLIVVLMLVAGGLSAFMNNIAAVAVMMPAVSSLARRAAIPPSRLFMPLAFGAILGGTTTLVGTPPNILTGALMAERGLEPFGLFEFTPIGIVLLLAGVLFMVGPGRALLPKRGEDRGAASTRELIGTYGLEARLFSVHVPAGSPLDGRSLAEARLGPTLNIEVLAIDRGERRIVAPDRETTLRGGDTLLVKGDRTLLEPLAKVRGVEVRPTSAQALPGLSRVVRGVRFALTPGSELIGSTLRDANFRERYGLVVVGIAREERLQMEDLAPEPLRESDELIALGDDEAMSRLNDHEGIELRRVGFRALEPLQDRLFVIALGEESPLLGLTIRESEIGRTVGLTVGGLIRDGVTRLGVSPDERLCAGDGLVVAGEAWRLPGLVELGDALPEGPSAASALGESDDTGVLEVALAPRASIAGETLGELAFRSRYGLQVLSIWSGGRSWRVGLTHRVLHAGDALLVQGPWDRFEQLARDGDFVVLSRHAQPARRTGKAGFALGGLAVMIGLVVSGLQPIHVAAFAAASLTLLSGALRMDEAYRTIEWRAIFLVAAVLPAGLALERTGAALLIAGAVTDLAGPYGPYAVFGALVVLSSLLSQGLDGAPAVVLLAPVVFGVAEQSGIAPAPLLMGVSVAASAAFMTPFSHKANLLVMGAGSYRSGDYIKVGTPLTVIVLGLIVLVIPLLYSMAP